MEQYKYEEYCRALVQGLCADSTVKIERRVDDMGVLLEVSGVSKSDMGMVIGKGGATISAIRTLVKAAGALEKSRVSVKVLEPEGSAYGKADGGRMYPYGAATPDTSGL